MTASADKFARLAALKPARSAPPLRVPSALRAPEEDDAIGNILGAGVARNHYGEHLVIRNWFSSPEFQGASPVTLELLSHSRDEWISRKTRAAIEDTCKWLFLDTETTGLAGGTGTYAFLVGLAWWDAGGLQVEQFFMRDFTEEYSLLHELAERVAERPVLVTFNGKAFDWPLLENRFAMTRTIRAPNLATHLDLLHPARALWKLRLGSVRLVELESNVLDAPRLGWHRGDDVSSALIPQFYFDYLRGGRAEPLAGVVKHNAMDLRGLAALFGKIDAMLGESGDALEEWESLDLLGLSRFLRRRGDSARAQSACSQALAIGLPAEFRPKAQRDLAQLAKRKGDYEQAVRIWEELVRDSADGIHACEQLAIYYERRAGDLARAVEYVRLGLQKIPTQRVPVFNPAQHDPYPAARLAWIKSKFTERLKRLERKSARSSSARQPASRKTLARKANPALW